MRRELINRVISSLVLIPLTFFFVIKGSFFLIFFLIIFFIIAVYEWFNMNKGNIFISYFGIVFLFLSFFSAFVVRENIGLYFFLLILVICIFTDIGGYLFGKTFKGPKLTKISPNKTYSGVFGSFLISIFASHIFIKFYEIEVLFTDKIFILLVILISLVSQLGDLIISYFKRKTGIKDTGNILPGHGGLLDRIDGLIFVLPVVYLASLTLK